MKWKKSEKVRRKGGKEVGIVESRGRIRIATPVRRPFVVVVGWDSSDGHVSSMAIDVDVDVSQMASRLWSPFHDEGPTAFLWPTVHFFLFFFFLFPASQPASQSASQLGNQPVAPPAGFPNHFHFHSDSTPPASCPPLPCIPCIPCSLLPTPFQTDHCWRWRDFCDFGCDPSGDAMIVQRGF